MSRPRPPKRPKLRPGLLHADWVRDEAVVRAELASARREVIDVAGKVRDGIADLSDLVTAVDDMRDAKTAYVARYDWYHHDTETQS